MVMEENYSWKIVYLAAIFSLIILGIAYYLISPRQSPYFVPEKVEKIAEIKKTRIEGRKEGKKVWEFFAEEGWVSKDREITYFSNVRRGKIYKDSELCVTDLSASLAKAYRHSQIVEASGAVRAYLDLGKFSAQPKPESEWTKIIADYIKYFPTEKRSEISGRITLIQKDSAISCDTIKINHDTKVADILGNIRLKRKNGIIKAEAIQYLGEAEQLNASGGVSLNLLEGNIQTIIKCQQATFYNDIEKDINLSGSLEVTQGKKLAICPEGIYSKKENGLFLKGGVRAILEKGKAILKEETVKKLQNPEIKKILSEKTVVTANEIFFSTKTGDARATGSVEVTQKGHEARSDLAIYDDQNEILTLSRNAYLKRGEDWIKCQMIVISIPKETFEAVGSVEAKFKL